MKLIIEITENSYKYLKSKRNKSAAENVIANGLIYREQPTGEWLHRNDDQFDWLECSRCGWGSEGEVEFGHGTPFCPICGAKMKEGEEG